MAGKKKEAKPKVATVIATENFDGNGDPLFDMVEQGDSLKSIEQANPEALAMCPENFPHLFDEFGNKK